MNCSRFSSLLQVFKECPRKIRSRKPFGRKSKRKSKRITTSHLTRSSECWMRPDLDNIEIPCVDPRALIDLDSMFVLFISTHLVMIRCLYSLYFRASVPVGSANLSGRICRSKDVATLRCLLGLSPFAEAIPEFREGCDDTQRIHGCDYSHNLSLPSAEPMRNR